MKKLFKDKKKQQKQEKEASMRLNDMPPPPSVPNQDPRYSQRESNPPMGQDPRYSQQRVHQQYDAPPPTRQEDPRRSQRTQQQQYDAPPPTRQEDPRRSQRTQQQQYDAPPPTRQEVPRHSHQRAQQSRRQDPQRHSQQQDYDHPPEASHRQSRRSPRQSAQAREKTYDEPPPRQQAPAPQQQRRSAPAPAPAHRSAPPQEFQPTQAPPKKEKAPPVVTNMDPVAQMERAAITRELVKQYVADIWNRGDLDLIPKVCARGLRFNGSAGMDRVGHDGFRRMVETIRGSLEDYHCEIHSMVVEGNKAFCRMRFTGRHTGQLLGYESTGKHVSWMGASEFTVVDGMIVKVWELGDMASLEHQLREASGMPPAPVGGDGEC